VDRELTVNKRFLLKAIKDAVFAEQRLPMVEKANIYTTIVEKLAEYRFLQILGEEESKS
jgi:hypothetical protein